MTDTARRFAPPHRHVGAQRWFHHAAAAGRGSLVGCALLAASCGDFDERDVFDCEEVEDQYAYVEATMRDYYLWADDIPKLDYSEYPTIVDLVRAMRFEADRWTGISPEPEVRAFYAGRSVGMGFRMTTENSADGPRLRIVLAYEGSPAEAAGLERGMELLEINGVSVEQIRQEGTWAEVLGPDEPGVEVQMLVRRVDGTEFATSAVKQELTRTSVFDTEVFDYEGMRVGYIMFEQFINPSIDALTEAFGTLKAEGAQELVLDLRYNTGGLLDVTRFLASLITGPSLEGETFLRFDHNARQDHLNEVMEFRAFDTALPFDRVAFLVGRSTASASEALINGLAPWIDVRVIGDRTLGKPVGSNGFTFCKQILQPITFSINNVDREGGYFEGIAPDCSAPDDLDHLLGDPGEARMASALAWLAGNADCPQASAPSTGLVGFAAARGWLDAGELVQGPGVDGYYGLF